jgi:hypothetical protein
MRRLLLIVLACVLPLKSVAAAVVPIVGVPAPLLAVHASAADPGAHGAALPPCHVQADLIDPDDHAIDDGTPAHGTDGDRLHKQSCPHLAMATILMPTARTTFDPLPPARPATRTTALVSVVLDVPRPPPTAT